MNPWSYLKKVRHDRFLRRRGELVGYLEVATPIALAADQLYRDWRQTVAEPIQDGQRAANVSATCWWQITQRLRTFERLTPPRSAARYHRTFADALRNASHGLDVAKNGFRFNKYSELSRAMGYLDRYLEQMARAEKELGRLLREYHLIDGQ